MTILVALMMEKEPEEVIKLTLESAAFRWTISTRLNWQWTK